MANVRVINENKKPSNDNQKTIYLDTDDTCLDSLGTYIRWLAWMGRIKNPSQQPIKDRNNLAPWLGIDEDLERNWYDEFSNSSWQWGTMPALPDTKICLGHLISNGWKIVAMSANGNGAVDRAVLKRANLEMALPGIFQDCFLIKYTNNWYAFFTEKEETVFISGNQKRCLEVAEAGHVSYLLDRPWNKDFSDMRVRRFQGWKELALLLTSQ